MLSPSCRQGARFVGFLLFEYSCLLSVAESGGAQGLGLTAAAADAAAAPPAAAAATTTAATTTDWYQ